MEKLKVNNELILVRKQVEHARILIIRKLIRLCHRLKDIKGPEGKVTKNLHRAERKLEEVNALKKIDVNEVAKDAFLKENIWDQVVKQKDISSEERASARLKGHKLVQNVIKNFRENNPSWEAWIPSLIDMWDRKRAKKKLKKSKVADEQGNMEEETEIPDESTCVHQHKSTEMKTIKHKKSIPDIKPQVKGSAVITPINLTDLSCDDIIPLNVDGSRTSGSEIENMDSDYPAPVSQPSKKVEKVSSKKASLKHKDLAEKRGKGKRLSQKRTNLMTSDLNRTGTSEEEEGILDDSQSPVEDFTTTQVEANESLKESSSIMVKKKDPFFSYGSDDESFSEEEEKSRTSQNQKSKQENDFEPHFVGTSKKEMRFKYDCARSDSSSEHYVIKNTNFEKSTCFGDGKNRFYNNTQKHSPNKERRSFKPQSHSEAGISTPHSSKGKAKPSLHPSWEAKRQLKEKQSSILPFQGTKIKFT